MTTLTRWAPTADLIELRDRLDRVFDQMTDGDGRAWVPRVDVVSEKERMVLRADIPGIMPEELEITAEEGVLTISGKHEETKEEKDED